MIRGNMTDDVGALWNGQTVEHVGGNNGVLQGDLLPHQLERPAARHVTADEVEALFRRVHVNHVVRTDWDVVPKLTPLQRRVRDVDDPWADAGVGLAEPGEILLPIAGFGCRRQM